MNQMITAPATTVSALAAMVVIAPSLGEVVVRAAPTILAAVVSVPDAALILALALTVSTDIAWDPTAMMFKLPQGAKTRKIRNHFHTTLGDNWIYGYNYGGDETTMDSMSAPTATAGDSDASITAPPTSSKPVQNTSPGVTAKPSQNTEFISCSHRNQNPGEGINTAYCVCDGSTFAESMNTAVTPHNSCAYTEKPTSTAAIHTGFAATTDKDASVHRSLLLRLRARRPPSNLKDLQADGGGPSDDEINKICKQVTDDCADGVMDQNHHLMYSLNGFLDTRNFATGSAVGNTVCPNNDECQKAFHYLASNMRYPSALGFPDPYCSGATLDIYGYHDHKKIGVLIVIAQTLRRGA
ncbi:hypothetical protein MBLNU13_g04211t3 [Cladosporium sp. NU13]